MIFKINKKKNTCHFTINIFFVAINKIKKTHKTLKNNINLDKQYAL